MKTGLIKKAGLILILFAFILSIPAAAHADETEAVAASSEEYTEASSPADDAPAVSKTLIRETFDDAPDPDALLSAYLQSSASRPVLFKARSAMPGSLSGINQYVYNSLVPALERIASGETSSTAVRIDLSDYVRELSENGEKISWTAADLGLDSLSDESGVVSGEAEAAFMEAAGFTVRSVVYAVSLNSPNSIFWRGLSYDYYYPYTVTKEGDAYALTFDDTFEIWFSVSPDYAVNLRLYDGSYDEDTEQLADIRLTLEDGSVDVRTCVFSKFEVDPSRIGAVNAAVRNADAIVSEAAGLSDLDKLSFYRERIHALVSFDSSADTDSYPGGYGDPWQIIYVFDGDSSTNVVCEGFAKAFQYLCDRTVFDRSDVCCSTVTGYLGGSQPHMWNIISIGENNYFVDLTNDTSAHELFLLGYAGGSVAEGYTFSETYTHLYTYDDDTRAVYPESALTIVPQALPRTPVLLKLKNSSTGITVTWEAAENAQGYSVYRKENESDFILQATLSGADIQSWIDTDVKGGTLYTYQIAAFNYEEDLEREHTGEYSNALSIFCLRRSAITSFTSKAPGFSLVWNAVDGAEGYLVYRKTADGAYKKIKKFKTPDVVSWTDSSVEEAQTCSYKVIAYKIYSGKVYKSCATTAKTKYRLDQPASPTLLKSSSYVRVRWTEKEAVDGYIIYRKEKGGKLSRIKTIQKNTTLTWKDKTVSKDVKYTYKIKAYKKIGTKTYYSICSAGTSIRF